MEVIYQVVGIREVDYINKNNKNVKGRTLFVTYSTNGVVGLATKDFYCNGDVANMIMVDDCIKIYFNEFGKVAQIVKL